MGHLCQIVSVFFARASKVYHYARKIINCINRHHYFTQNFILEKQKYITAYVAHIQQQNVYYRSAPGCEIARHAANGE